MAISLTDAHYALNKMFKTATKERKEYIDVSIIDLMNATKADLNNENDWNICIKILKNTKIELLEIFKNGTKEGDELLNETTVRFLIPRSRVTNNRMESGAFVFDSMLPFVKKEITNDTFNLNQTQRTIKTLIETFFHNTPNGILMENQIVNELCKIININHEENYLINPEDIRKVFKVTDLPLKLRYGKDDKFTIKVVKTEYKPRDTLWMNFLEVEELYKGTKQDANLGKREFHIIKNPKYLIFSDDLPVIFEKERIDFINDSDEIKKYGRVLHFAK